MNTPAHPPTDNPPKVKGKVRAGAVHVAAANATAASFAALTARLDYLTPADIEQVRLAYRFADEAHLGQLRNNGEPYITHPIAVAAQCADWRLDAQALMAALLHDAIEDCGVTKSELIERFGSAVAEAAVKSGAGLLELKRESLSLEEVFLKLTTVEPQSAPSLNN